MVNVGQKYNLNHIYDEKLYNGTILVGASSDTIIKGITLFERSLALTSDLKRLPILRSLSFLPDISALIVSSMTASNLTNLKVQIELFNENLTAEEYEIILADQEGLITVDRIWGATIHAYYNASLGFQLQIDCESWDFEGGKLLNDKLTLGLYAQANGNVAGTSFPPSMAGFTAFLEIDWVPVTKNEFQEFILENVYANDD